MRVVPEEEFSAVNEEAPDGGVPAMEEEASDGGVAVLNEEARDGGVLVLEEECADSVFLAPENEACDGGIPDPEKIAPNNGDAAVEIKNGGKKETSKLPDGYFLLEAIREKRMNKARAEYFIKCIDVQMHGVGEADVNGQARDGEDLAQAGPRNASRRRKPVQVTRFRTEETISRINPSEKCMYIPEAADKEAADKEAADKEDADKEASDS